MVLRTEVLRIGLPIYIVVYFGIAFVLQSVIVARRVGKNPFVMPNDDSTYGLIGLYFKLTMIGLVIYVVKINLKLENFCAKEGSY